MDEVHLRKLVESLLADLKSIHNESKKKYPAIREACEGGILKLRTIPNTVDDARQALSESAELYRPLLMGCQSRNQKIVPTCLTSFQRLATCNCIGESQAPNIVNQLDQLSEHGVEELRVLQSVIVILTTSQVVQKDSLAKTVVLCFRLYFCHDSTVSSTAAATIRQILSVIIDRMITEDQQNQGPTETTGSQYSKCPQTLLPRAQDAYLLFQDLCQLTNGDPPYWLHGMTEMTRTFGLELLESVLRYYPHAFLAHPEFSFLLKERVCPLIIKLFSPNIKYKQNGQSQPTIVEKPVFPVSMRLLRIVSVLIKQFYTLLVTECEIFLSLLVKFLGTDKPFWQRALALEVLHNLCVQPQILKSLCMYYDMQEQSTKVFHDICVALDGFIQSLFCKEPNTSLGSSPSSGPVVSPTGPASTAVVERVQTQSGFLYQGVWIPLNNLPPAGTSKPLYLEQLDFKNDTPNVSETYGLTICFACILEIARGLEVFVHVGDSRQRVRTFIGKLGEESFDEKGTISADDVKSNDSSRPTLGAAATSIAKKMIEASCDSMLSVLSQLLEASTDESVTESILKAIQTYASVCGLLGFSNQRDAFVSMLCKAALPSNCPILANLENQQHKPPNQFDIQFVQGGNKNTLPLQSLTGSGSSSNLTSRNLQCMRAILSLAHCHGDILASEWYVVLLTLQHLSVITGIKASNSANKSLQANEVQSSTMAPGVMAELPVLTAMLARLFESSQYLDDVSLHHLVSALCRLSSEDMEQAINGKEPCLFPSSKLLQIGLFNLGRLKVLWKPLTAHLLEVAQHPHARLRELGGDALTSLIRSAITFDHATPLSKDFALQQMILNPLQEMAGITYSDVRQQQYECVLHIVQRTAPQLQQAWPMVLQIIGSATNQQSESIIRQAFQSLQLVITDFLPIMPCWCLQVLIGVVGRFGLQPLEINISLTAVGLLWNLSDFLYQNRVALKHDLEVNLEELEKVNSSKSPGNKEEVPQWQFRNIPPFDSLWICMFSKLGELCVDPRPAVRKSAGQTLFSTINAHGGLLESGTWYTVLWKVLFPLLEKVKTMSSAAADVPPPSDTINVQGSILIHHTRDTAEKQWAETRVLTLAGVARVFSTRKHILSKLEEYPRAWALLLELLESGALSKNAEVALNSLKSFQEIVQDANEVDKKDEKDNKESKPGKGKNALTRINIKPVKFVTVSEEDLDYWIQAWRVWLNIGTVSMSQEHMVRTLRDPDGKFRTQVLYPSQGYLTALVLVFPCLLGRIYSRFGIGDLQRLCSILDKCISIPIHTDSSLYLLPVMQESGLSTLQQIVVHAVLTLKEPVLQLQSCSILDTTSYAMYPDIFRLLLRFVDYACSCPKLDNVDKSDMAMNKKKMNEHIVQNYVPFSEKCMQILAELYQGCYSRETVVSQNILEDIIKTLHTPLKLKYACPSQSTWKLSIKSLVAVLQCGLPVIIEILKDENSPKNYLSMWVELSSTLEDFLFSTSPPPETQTLEQHRADEQIDIKVLTLIREEILPHSEALPQEFVDRLMKLLNRGSIHSATYSAFEGDFVNFPMREEFARRCFETLLHFSFVKSSEGKESSSGLLSKLALGSLLQRCKDILKKYAHDERLNGKFPLPRARMAEMLFAMKAVTALLASLKETHASTPEAVDLSMWQEVISIYPALLECITCRSDDVRIIVKDALGEFMDLLSVPPKRIFEV